VDYQQLEDLFDQLWPIARSISGPGIKESLEIIKKVIPLEIKEVKTGEVVFDWTIPPEWKLNSASLYTDDGEKILSTADTNIHVLNFSEPFSGYVDFDELDKHLFSDPSFPEVVPYVTSYYVRRWGLCLSDRKRQALKKNIKYRVEIDTEIYDGYLRYGEAVLKGKSEKTVLLSSYLCHPSLANNELSGPLSLVGLYKKIAAKKERFYTYRFLFIPETIGSITFLAKTPKEELEKIESGIVLTCCLSPKIRHM
jgi:aminopeptidase-like protein